MFVLVARPLGARRPRAECLVGVGKLLAEGEDPRDGGGALEVIACGDVDDIG